jgi:hypothetical protein
MALLKAIRLYVSEFWPDWISKLSGIASVILLLIGAFWSINRWEVLLASVVCYIVASFRVWHIEYKKRVDAERQLQDEKFRKQTAKERIDETDAIVRKAAFVGYRTLVKHMHGNISPRFFLNENWVRQVAEQNGRTIAEIDQAVDRVDGTFHWQSGG